ncbi:MAG: RNA polymerase factor sigma-54 [Ignavibacteriae bacterium]|nr:RNA polymerase factor sigma-54 [Ignavibacteriota bacterium]
MKLSLSLQTSMLQTLTPQQIQYLKLLQLPVLQLEQHIRQEIEENPMLEELEDSPEVSIESDDYEEDIPSIDRAVMERENFYDESGGNGDSEGYDDYSATSTDSFDENHHDPFEFYELAWNESAPSDTPRNEDYDDSDYFQPKDVPSFIDELLTQLRFLDLTKEELIVGEYLIGNIDADGYLRRELVEIVQEVNDVIGEYNLKTRKALMQKERAALVSALDQATATLQAEHDNPARNYALDDQDALVKAKPKELPHAVYYDFITYEQAEKILKEVQKLDPPGIGSRTVKECLIAQLKAVMNPSAVQKLALKVLENNYEAFAMKHYPVITKSLGISDEELKEVIDVIRRLNPKPGGGSAAAVTNSVIPDFMVDYDEEKDDIIININDSRIPALGVNVMYEKLKKEARYKKFNKETSQWLRKKYDDAKFLLQAIKQRKVTMLKVMTGIAGLQKEFFMHGENAIKPLIYKDVAEDTGLDVSTICRIVNGKFVQTGYGTFELRYFFSESLPSDDGEEVSTRIVKQRIREMVDKEPKGKPYSDEKLTKELKKAGLNVARRTVAKYREQMRIPVARLRKEL